MLLEIKQFCALLFWEITSKMIKSLKQDHNHLVLI